MKKSSALMLSYIIFLTVSIVANLIFDWGELEKISMAATIAGCFFAFGDLANWYISFFTPIVNAYEKDYESFIRYFSASLTTVDIRLIEIEACTALMTPYAEEYDIPKDFFARSKELSTELSKMKRSLENSIKKGDEAKKLLEKLHIRLIAVNRIEIIFVTIGFFTFFSIIAFTWFFDFLFPFQTIATVLAFIIIMLNYYLRDILEEKSKLTIDEILSRVKEEQKEIETMLQKSANLPLLDTVNELIKKVNYLEELKKEKENGQA